MKFYNIKIGTHTKADNFNALQSFVAQSDKTQSSIYSYYSNKYKGFNVLVEEIIEVIKDEIPMVANNSYNEFSKTPNELEIDRLNNIIAQKEKESEFNLFSGKIRYDSTQEVKNELQELEKRSDLFKSQEQKVINELKSAISNKYGAALLETIRIENFLYSDTYFKFECKLNGSIRKSDNEI